MARQVAGIATQGRGGHILIVDDNLGLAENIAEILEGQGHTTDVAASAEEALGKALTRDFSVLVTDFRLPGMNGIELVRTIRHRGQHVVAIVISAYADEETMTAASEVGARFLEKPLNCATLNSLIVGREGAT